ncbi:NusG domain II-containing protein [Treponema sp.]|uniref:NusG domain II-containing protein n=1 Tax=Treponema sp. TaxID=166 RepID=UPI003F0B3DCD
MLGKKIHAARQRLKCGDFIIALVFLAAIFLSFYILARNKIPRPPQLRVHTPNGEFLYPLSKDGIYTFEGALGETSVQIKDGKASFANSPCQNKNCIQAGEISADGQWAACLPNKIFISIEGSAQEDGFDAISN